ncbi:MAG: hypothetical protein Q8K74_07475 [Candidatus Nitrotoga sp.]|nr:hypothetical protein [Candidatus Nitrotoga sp.]MDP1855871.1 hypothetical protein [Candidatus Nitrotoga sp.]
MNTIQKWGALLFTAISLIVALSTQTTASALEMRATFLKECPTTDQPTKDMQPESLEAIALGIAGSLAGSLVDSGMTMLKKSLTPDAVSIEGQFLQQGLYVYREDQVGAEARVILNPAMTCLVIAVGEFGVNQGNWTLPFEVAKDRKKDASSKLAKSLKLKKPPTLYFEAVQAFSNDKSAVTWKPVRFYVGQHLASSFWAGKSRGIQIEMKLYAPAGDKPFLGQDFSFPEVTKPFEYNGDEMISGGRGTWMVLPAPSMSSSTTFAPTPVGNPFDPFTLDIRIVESPKPYRLAQMFVGAAEGQKETIKTEIKTSLDSQGKIVTKHDAKNATLTSIDNFVDFWGKANKACKSGSIADEAGKFSCALAKNKAAIAREKAQLSCKSLFVDSCATLPKVK